MRDKPLFDEKFRVTKGALASTPKSGVVGAFIIPTNSISTLNKTETLNQPGHYLQIISHDGKSGFYEGKGEGTGWEHVSVTVLHSPTGETYCPLWEQMAVVKQAFWTPEERVVQYHPKKSEYVDMHKDVLHLFRPLDTEVPSPPTDLLAPSNPNL